MAPRDFRLSLRESPQKIRVPAGCPPPPPSALRQRTAATISGFPVLRREGEAGGGGGSTPRGPISSALILEGSNPQSRGSIERKQSARESVWSAGGAPAAPACRVSCSRPGRN